MSTDFVQWDEVLGLVALGFHQVARKLAIEGVIKGGLVSGWYYTWSISGLQVFRDGVVPLFVAVQSCG